MRVGYSDFSTTVCEKPFMSIPNMALCIVQCAVLMCVRKLGFPCTASHLYVLQCIKPKEEELTGVEGAVQKQLIRECLSLCNSAIV